MITLIGRSLARVQMVFIAIVVVLMAFQAVLVATAASFADAGTFERLESLLPRFVKHNFGSALSSFEGMTTVGYFEPLLVLVIVMLAMHLATELAGEVESGLVDLVLARPLPRHRLVSRSLLVMTVGAVVPPLAMAGAMWLGLIWFAPPGARWPDALIVVLLVGQLAAVAWCCGAVALAATAWARRRGAVQSVVAVGAVTLYLAEFVSRSWAPARALAWLSPFHYHEGPPILDGTASLMWDFGVLAAAGCAAVAVSYWKFNQRDL